LYLNEDQVERKQPALVVLQELVIERRSIKIAKNIEGKVDE
jgi:hypothetical protein